MRIFTTQATIQFNMSMHNFFEQTAQIALNITFVSILVVTCKYIVPTT